MPSATFVLVLALTLVTSLPMKEPESPKGHRSSAAAELPLQNGRGSVEKTLHDSEIKDSKSDPRVYSIRDNDLTLTLEGELADMQENVREVACSDGDPCYAMVGGRGSLLGFYGVSFDTAPGYVYVRLASDLQYDFGYIQFYRDVLQESPIATVMVQGTGGLDQYETFGGFFDNGLAGTHDLYAVLEYGENKEFVAINWIQFITIIPPTTTTTPSTTTTTPINPPG